MRVADNNTAIGWEVMYDSNATGTVIPATGNAMIGFDGSRGAMTRLYFPEQAPIIQLVKNLAAWRREKASKYLVAGKMEKCPKVECATVVIHRVDMPDFAAPAVLASAWRAENGARAVILANTTQQEQPCTVEGHPETIVVPPLDATLLIIK